MHALFFQFLPISVIYALRDRAKPSSGTMETETTLNQDQIEAETPLKVKAKDV